jgi:hypothetical protein
MPGQMTGRFAWQAPAWAQPLLSPEGMYLFPTAHSP